MKRPLILTSLWVEDTHRITKSKYLFVLLHDTVKMFLRQQYCPPGAYNLKQSTLIVDPVIKALYQMQTLYLLDVSSQGNSWRGQDQQ